MEFELLLVSVDDASSNSNMYTHFNSLNEPAFPPQNGVSKYVFVLLITNDCGFSTRFLSLLYIFALSVV